MKHSYLFLLYVPLVLALEPGIEVNSGVVGPLGSSDNRKYDPSVYIESSLLLNFSQAVMLRASYGQLFANGGEYIENSGPFGDSFGNYWTDSFFLKTTIRRNFGGFVVGGGLGYWSYETNRDVIDWDAD